MKRYNLVQARGGDFSFGAEGMIIEGEGNDVIELAVTRGKVSLIVPVTQPDGDARDVCFRNHSYLDLELEDGTHITGSVRNGEAHLEATSPGSRPRHPMTKKTTRARAKPALVRRRVLSRGGTLE